MKITIESTDALADTLRVVGGLYGVTLSVADESTADAPSESAADPAPAAVETKRPSRSSKGRTAAASRGTGRRSRVTDSTDSSTPDMAAVRSWARENGRQVSDRGRVSNALVEAYRTEMAAV